MLTPSAIVPIAMRACGYFEWSAAAHAIRLHGCTSAATFSFSIFAVVTSCLRLVSAVPIVWAFPLSDGFPSALLYSRNADVGRVMTMVAPTIKEECLYDPACGDERSQEGKRKLKARARTATFPCRFLPLRPSSSLFVPPLFSSSLPISPLVSPLLTPQKCPPSSAWPCLHALLLSRSSTLIVRAMVPF